MCFDEGANYVLARRQLTRSPPAAQLVTTIAHYSRPLTYPALTRFLALLRDSEILSSRLGYHEAARIFIDASSPPDPISPLPSFEQVIMKTIPIFAALLPPSKNSDYVRTCIQNTFYKVRIDEN